MDEQAPRQVSPPTKDPLEQEGLALVERINEWRQEGRVREALALCDEELPRFQQSREPAMRLLVLRLGLSRALCLSGLHRNTEALALCDELLQRHEGTASGPEMHLRIARTIAFKCHLLEMMDREAEAFELYDELLRRYDGADDATLMEPVATALLGQASLLRSSAARLEVFRQVVRRFKDSPVTLVRTQVAMAAAQLALGLRRRGRSEEEVLSVCDEVLAHLRGAREPELLSAAALLLSIKASTLEEMNQVGPGLACYDETLRLLEDEHSVQLRDEWARTLLNKAFRLKQCERFMDALACYDTLVQRLGRVSEAKLRERAARGQLEKAQLLEQLGRQDEALSIFDEVVQRWGEDSAVEVRAHGVEALLDKGLLWLKRKQVDEAVATLKDVVRRAGDCADETMREQAARALLYEAVGLWGLKRGEEGQAALDEALRRFGDPAGAGVLVQAARELMDKDELVVGLGLLQEALSVFDAVLGRFARPPDVLREHVVRALGRTGLVLLSEARRRWARTRESQQPLLEQSRLKAVAVLELEPEEPIYLGQAGYVSFLAGHREVARGFVRKALRLGGEKQKRFFVTDPTHPFPEDPEFQALVHSL